MSIVYLIHFDQPIGSTRHQAQHYIGFASKSLKKRLEEHRNGNGAAIMAEVARRGITWKVVKTWSHGTRVLERQLKNQKHAWTHCPVCKSIKKGAKNHE